MSSNGIRATDPYEGARIYFEQKGTTIAVADIRRELIPFNYDILVSIRSTITRASWQSGLLLLPLPVRLRYEHTLYRSFQTGDVLVAHQMNSLAVLVQPPTPERLQLFKAGEVVEGLTNLQKLQSGDTVKLRVVTSGVR